MNKTESFIIKANNVHNNKYDYSLVEYTNVYTKVKIICTQHGLYEQKPNNHLRGYGCLLCGIITKNKNKVSKAESEFKDKANKIHGFKYDYSFTNYTGNKDKVTINCYEHGLFKQTPDSHLAGRGCAKCAIAEKGWTRTHFKDKCIKNNNGLGILYILECFNDKERFFKIGITSRSIKQRYSSKVQMPYAYSIVKEIIGDPEFIYDLETKLHKEHKQYKYIPSIPFAGGSSECFITYNGAQNEMIQGQ